MQAEEVLQSMNDLRNARDALQCDTKTISGMIRATKECMSKLYYGEELDKSYDTALRMLETLEEILLHEWYTKEEISTQNINDTAGWHLVADGELPEYHKDVLFCNRVMQVFEGFLEKSDTSKPYLTEDRKIAFPDYPDGGRWYDFRFRTFHEMKSIVAWCYKPKAVETEYGKREKRNNKRNINIV